MRPEDAAIAATLAQVGVAITPSTASAGGWGWSIANEKLIQPWVGPYPTSAAATRAALDWLMQRAWKGVLCEHTHSSPEPAVAERQDAVAALLAPWERAFENGTIVVE